MFTLSSTPLEAQNLKQEFADPSTGGLVCFEGWVRNHNDGRTVVSLDYEAAESLAQTQAPKIFQEAKDRFEIIQAKCMHRTGHLQIGDMAVWVGATAVHRDAAFKACRYIIDEIKTRLPIWKKEYYANGHSEWVNCNPCAQQGLPFSSSEYYSKQTILPEVGLSGQERLQNAKVLVVGAGGLGSPVLTYLCSAGVGNLGICEYDQLQISNLHRQFLYSYQDIGSKKTKLVEKYLKGLNPWINIIVHPEKLNEQNILDIADPYEIIVDCTDNFATKFLLNDYAVLNHKKLIQASLYQWEGQLRIYDPSQKTACLRCLWPETPNADCIGNCAEVGVLGAVPGILGSLQALETIKIILHLPSICIRKTLIMDLTNYQIRHLKETRDPNCPLCGKDPTITELRSCKQEVDDDLYIDLQNLSWKDFLSYQLVDIREHQEIFDEPVDVPTNHLPLSCFEQTGYTFNPERHYLLFCAKGLRSEFLAKKLRLQGHKNIYSLMGGPQTINAYFRKNASSQRR